MCKQETKGGKKRLFSVVCVCVHGVERREGKPLLHAHDKVFPTQDS